MEENEMKIQITITISQPNLGVDKGKHESRILQASEPRDSLVVLPLLPAALVGQLADEEKRRLELDKVLQNVEKQERKRPIKSCSSASIDWEWEDRVGVDAQPETVLEAARRLASQDAIEQKERVQDAVNRITSQSISRAISRKGSDESTSSQRSSRRGSDESKESTSL